MGIEDSEGIKPGELDTIIAKENTGRQKKLPSYWPGWIGYNEAVDAEAIRKRIAELKEENDKDV